jgi:toxin ParE1/3/4
LDNPDAADRFLDAAHLAFRELARTLGLGRPRKFPQTQLHHFHSFRIKGFNNYLVFYRSVPDGVEVFHVLHGARDLENY